MAVVIDSPNGTRSICRLRMSSKSDSIKTQKEDNIITTYCLGL